MLPYDICIQKAKSPDTSPSPGIFCKNDNLCCHFCIVSPLHMQTFCIIPEQYFHLNALRKMQFRHMFLSYERKQGKRLPLPFFVALFARNHETRFLPTGVHLDKFVQSRASIVIKADNEFVIVFLTKATWQSALLASSGRRRKCACIVFKTKKTNAHVRHQKRLAKELPPNIC